MVDIVEINGQVFHVDPDLISAVAGPSIEVPRFAVEVFGITGNPISTKESPDSILSKLGDPKQFARLTRPDKSPIWVRGKAVQNARSPLNSETMGHPHGSVGLTIYIGGSPQPIRETAREAGPLLSAAGSKIFNR